MEKAKKTATKATEETVAEETAAKATEEETVAEETAAKAIEETVAQVKEEVDPGEELVTITIPMDYSRPTDQSLSLQVNGETILIQRNKPVQVKRKFAEAYYHSEEQRGHAMAVMYAMQQTATEEH